MEGSQFGTEGVVARVPGRFQKKLVPLASVLSRYCSARLRAERIVDPHRSYNASSHPSHASGACSVGVGGLRF
jgi:hypothetical protein